MPEFQRNSREDGDASTGRILAGVVVVVAVVVLLAWLVFATVYGIPLGGGTTPSVPTGGGGATRSNPANMYITIEINPVNGEPQFSPANFSVPMGYVEFTIVNMDGPANYSGCPCNVTGTVGNAEQVDGASYSQVPNSNVGHTFDVPSLGINVLDPGQSTITFELDLTAPGSYPWFCETPCGANGFTGPPMGVPGYMDGTMTVS